MENRRERERGQGLVEFAILLPFLLIVLAGALDLGRMYYVSIALTDAAGEGAAYAAIYPDDLAQVAQRAQDATSGMVSIDASLVQVDAPVIATGAPITVTVGYTFTMFTPVMNAIVPGGALMLRSNATERILSGSLGG